MTRKNVSSPEPTGTKPNVLLSPPDIGALAEISITDPDKTHPAWIKEQFPEYVDPHAGHEARTVREINHKGHVVRIVTTYQVEVDGVPVQAHLFVDDAGQVHTHATPFVTYGSALDLMTAVIDAYPESFIKGDGDGAEQPDHHAHGAHHDQV
ncbi:MULTISPECIES: hypothetical protein [Pseudomonas]|uniref:Uncharacterized protein n=1 Tax=Pseudomonas wuhanensis TaxID=2954098 RepID=A0ABY9GYL9_9PSED|nr:MULTISPECIES: hypothetical protein [unclassified Pseudomonas]WLI14841.1 hypothetical protein PSH65_12270 [Pseudomonas sp. FP603]WLI20765.1 hypothetical protein PSH88_12295 [Pseudomonas sp. FP607]